MRNVKNSKVTIRTMETSDIDSVSGLEQAIFPCPWSEEGIRGIITEDKLVMPYVAELDEEIVGYLFLWVVLDEVHIGNIAVKEGFRHKKIGTLLMEHGINEAAKKGGREFYLEVRVSNQPAIKLYEKFGFVSSYIRKNYYSDNREDALIMHKSLGN